MKLLLFSFLLFFAIISQAQERRDREEHEQNEVMDDQYLAPDIHVMRTKAHKQTIQAASSTLSSIFTIQVNIDSAGNNIIHDAANEPSLAISPVNPNSIVIGWRQFDNVLSNFRQAGFSYSSDGGATWAKVHVIEPGIFHSDPVLDCDSSGNFYYNSLHSDSLGNFSCTVFKSTNGGATWDNGTFAHGGDKQWMVIDKKGIGINNVYTAWSSNATSCLGDDFTRSTDGGLSYEPCEFVSGDPKFGTMDMDNSGALYYTGMSAVQPNGCAVVSKCISPETQNPPLAWNYTNVYMDGVDLISDPSTINPGGLIGQTNIAADHSAAGSGNLYLAASLKRLNSNDEADVMFCKSTDGGQTWTQPQKVNDDTTTHGQQWFATLSVSPNGRIDLVWLDTRDFPFVDSSALYYTYSYDQGTSWSVNEKLSGTFNPHLGYPAQNKMGDYFDMISDNASARLAWANTFNGEQDVYYSIITPPSPNVLAELSNPSLTVYPNPSSGLIRLSSPAIIISAEVFSVTGSKILEQLISASVAEMDLKSLPGGVYILNVHFDNGRSVVKKLIINNRK